MKKLQKLNLKTKELSAQEMKNVKGGSNRCTAVCADGSVVTANCPAGDCYKADGSGAWCLSGGDLNMCGGY